LYLLVTLYKVPKCFRSSLVNLSERGLFVLMHMSGSMWIAQEQGLVNGSESLCNKLQEQSLRVVGMLTSKIMHPPLARLAFMIVFPSCLQVRQRSELTLVSEIWRCVCFRSRRLFNCMLTVPSGLPFVVLADKVSSWQTFISRIFVSTF
jgi:hypothetical protein